MDQNHDDDAAASTYSFFTDPWSQAVVSGVLTLIPARKYPQWLRRGIIWTPAVVAGAGVAFLSANPRAYRMFVDKVGDSRATDPKTTEEPAAQHSPGSIALAAGVSTAVGALMSASIAVSFWADEKIERGLRRLRMPCPRAVMGAAAGAAAWRMVVEDNKRSRTAS